MAAASDRSPRYNRILLKLSGEALAGDEGFGIDPKVLDAMAIEIGQLVGIGVQVGLVIGGGNLFRGAALQASGLDRVAGDHMGMLATVKNGEVVVFCAGTGNPFFTTDSAACLRGIEIGADVVLKATKVDGVFDSDPEKNPKAVKYDRLSYDEVLARKLGVMDLTAICLVRDHDMPLRVFNMNKKGALLNLMLGGSEGTLVESA